MHDIEAKSILTSSMGMNPYRGCTHGCIYCDTRSKCYGFTHPIEDVGVKANAPMLLEKALRSKRKRSMIGTGSMCDPYQPIEQERKIMRQCLEIIDRYSFGAGTITKSDLVLRDLDLYSSIHEKSKAVIQISMTCIDDDLSSVLEPHVCNTNRRYEVLKEFQKAGIPTVVWLCPVLPFLTDTEENICGILERCADAGVKGIVCFGMGLTLREGDREYYYGKLDRHFPGLKEQYHRTYGYAYSLPSPNEKQLMKVYREYCRRYGILSDPDEVFSYLKEYPDPYEQMSLF